MGLIEQLGGYEYAKSKTIPWLLAYGLNWQDAKNRELLEYRRQHNIFERGDLIVYHTLPHERLFSVRHVDDNSIVVYELWDEMGAKTFSEFAPYSDIRHATDAEIKEGRRL